jgi:hypothetical protein
MAIGNKGFYATTQAPNVDFGAMVDKGIDKKLARDEAEDAKRLKAKADEDAARKSKLNRTWAKTKDLGRDMADESVHSAILDLKARGGQAKRMYESTGDPQYLAEYNRAYDVVDNMASFTTQASKSIENITKLIGDGKINEDFADEWEDALTSINDGKYAIRIDKNGNGVIDYFKTNADGEIETTKSVGLTEVLKEPMKSFDWFSEKKNFLDTVELDENTKSSYYTRSETTKLIDERIGKQVDGYVDELSKDESAMAEWFVNRNGGGREGVKVYRNRKDNKYSEDDYIAFKKEKRDDIMNSIAETRKEESKRYIEDTGGDGGKKPKVVDLNYSNKASGYSYEGFDKQGNKTKHSGNKFTVTTNLTDKSGKEFVLDVGDKKLTMNEFVYDPVMGAGIVVSSSDRISLSDRSSESIKGDPNSSSVGESTSISIEKGKPMVIYRGQPGYSTLETKIKDTYGKDLKDVATGAYNEMLKLSDRYGEIDELRSNGGTEAQINELKEDIVADMKKGESPAKEGASKKQEEKSLEKRRDSQYKTLMSNSGLKRLVKSKNPKNFAELKKALQDKAESENKDKNYYVKEYKLLGNTTQQTKPKTEAKVKTKSGNNYE